MYMKKFIYLKNKKKIDSIYIVRLLNKINKELKHVSDNL